MAVYSAKIRQYHVQDQLISHGSSVKKQGSDGKARNLPRVSGNTDDQRDLFSDIEQSEPIGVSS